MDREKLLKEAEAVVLRGLAQGYASGAPATPMKTKFGWKYYDYEEDLWHLRDEYYVDPDTRRSIGAVTLEYGHGYPYRLIWVMNVGGWYKKEATPCLKAALLSAYKEGKFFGGRGASTKLDGYEYYGLVELNGTKGPSFKFSKGREYVNRIDTGENMGFHDFWCMALI